MRYIGNVGSGKSYNLATLVTYLRKRAEKNWDFDKNVVYISECNTFFRYADPQSLTLVRNGRAVLCEASQLIETQFTTK